MSSDSNILPKDISYIKKTKEDNIKQATSGNYVELRKDVNETRELLKEIRNQLITIISAKEEKSNGNNQ